MGALFFLLELPKFMDGVYRHYKGGLYEVVGKVVHSETLEDLVLYRSMEGSGEFPKDTLWVRPYKMFFEDVVVDGNQVARFTKI
jgi:hypothetical protein